MISPIPSIVGVLARNRHLLWCVTEPDGREHPVSAFLLIREEESNSHVRAILRGEKVAAYFRMPSSHHDSAAPADAVAPAAAGTKEPSKAPAKAPAKVAIKTPAKTPAKAPSKTVAKTPAKVPEEASEKALG